MTDPAFSGFIRAIEERLKKPLPGREAHYRMIPPERRKEFIYDAEKAKKSSVLLLLFESGGDICTVLIRRPDYPGIHGGQVALPGGKCDPDDQSPEDTALREAEEEVGIARSQVRVLGRLSPLFIPPSYYYVTPVVACTGSAPMFIADPKEVAGIFSIPVKEFCNEKRIKEKDIAVFRGTVYHTPYYDIEGLTIWGATAMIMSEFAAIAAPAL